MANSYRPPSPSFGPLRLPGGARMNSQADNVPLLILNSSATDLSTGIEDDDHSATHLRRASGTVSYVDVVDTERITDNLSNGSASSLQGNKTPKTSGPSNVYQFAPLHELKKWLPNVDPKHQSKLSDRVFLLRMQLSLTCAVFISNVALTAWGLSRYSLVDNVGTLYFGNCDAVNQFELWFHLLINALATLLLGASNFCMQILVSPTRETVDKMHAAGMSVTIGVPSMSNFWRVSRSSQLVWIVLALSSSGLHLVWNSAIFKSFPVQAYNIAYVTSDWSSNQTPWNLSGISQDLESNNSLASMQYFKNYDNLSNAECIQRYSEPLNCGQNVIVVTDTASDSERQFPNFANSSLIFFDTRGVEGQWLLQPTWLCWTMPHNRNWCGTEGQVPSANNFSVAWPLVNDFTHMATVKYCLSQGVSQRSEQCGLHFHKGLLIAVCAMNLVKCVALAYMCITTRRDQKEPGTQRLSTIGDAVASFLEHPPDEKSGRGMISMYDLVDHSSWGRTLSSLWAKLVPGPHQHITTSTDAEYETMQPRRWHRKSYRLFWAARKGRWIILFVFSCAAILVVIIVLITGVSGRMLSGLPAFNGINGVTSFIRAVLFANCFQLFIAILYLMYNSILSTLYAAYEWTLFIKERKNKEGFLIKERRALRVSSPRGVQRSSYFLSLPFKFGVPVSIASLLLHWFVSQSVFLVYTSPFSASNDLIHDNSATSYVGFSLLPVLPALFLALLMMAVLAVVAWRTKLDSRIPLVGTDSRAIAAACHPPKEDESAWCLPVRYGVVSSVNGIGHCALTTMIDVEQPKEGRVYE